MIVFYQLGVFLYYCLIYLLAPFHKKANKFISGRKNWKQQIRSLKANEPRDVIWIHCASLGEYEQGLPIIQALKEKYTNSAILVTFFSPSGYEHAERVDFVDYWMYLPIDTAGNAKFWVELVNPKMAVFVKYEFWHHYLHALKKNNTPIFLCSAVFQLRHPFFKWYGDFYRKMLPCFTHIFVQDENSLQLLTSIKVSNVTVTGDTRLDRVAQLANEPVDYPQLATWQEHSIFIAGSTWPDDEQLLLSLPSTFFEHYKLLIAPHDIQESRINSIIDLCNKKGLSSAIWDDSLSKIKTAQVLILNKIGILSRAYRYASVVWVGGGFTSSGIHNIMEPAAYSKAIFFGPRYQQYVEANELIALNAVKSVGNADALLALLEQPETFKQMQLQTEKYFLKHSGAVDKTMRYIQKVVQ